MDIMPIIMELVTELQSIKKTLELSDKSNRFETACLQYSAVLGELNGLLAVASSLEDSISDISIHDEAGSGPKSQIGFRDE
jgi:cell fate (sporulation/competence/biofilm development) regulator YlbF (YheA/YmcA/DUF963 family)